MYSGSYGIFSDELLSGEEILWQGQPEKQVMFTQKDIWLVPVSIFMALFISAFIVGFPAQAFNNDLFFTIWRLFFGSYVLYFVLGRFFVKYWKKANTYYAITNKRVLIMHRFLGSKLQTFAINALPGITKRVRSDGIGSIQIGQLPKGRWWQRNPADYSNTGLEVLSWAGTFEIPGLYDISNCNNVYHLLSELSTKALKI